MRASLPCVALLALLPALALAAPLPRTAVKRTTTQTTTTTTTPSKASPQDKTSPQDADVAAMNSLIGGDHRVHKVTYQPDTVFKFTGHYGFQSVIEFGEGETIQTISMGDSTAWMMQPLGSRLFLKPVEASATTNMTLITSKHTYLFELHAKEAQDINDPDMVFVLRFIYPGSGSGTGSNGVVQNYLESVPIPNIEDEPEKYNFKYTISGSQIISPIRIFDDGQFTYFEFRGVNTDLPAFFMVDENNNESLVNFRARGNYIVVERVAARFTLRLGNQIVCVFNEGYPQQLKPKPQS